MMYNPIEPHIYKCAAANVCSVLCAHHQLKRCWKIPRTYLPTCMDLLPMVHIYRMYTCRCLCDPCPVLGPGTVSITAEGTLYSSHLQITSHYTVSSALTSLGRELSAVAALSTVFCSAV